MANYPGILTVFLGLSFVLLSSTAAYGRPIADSSAGSKVRVDFNDNNKKVFVIQDGMVVGNKLFHSFKTFSIPKDQVVKFTLPPSKSIKTVFSRVTGKSISHLHGRLRVNGNTNLVFLNPNGIVFHEGFKLDIKGSFLATTAESIIFKDGDRFSSSLSDATPLLQLSVPIGLQFGENPGKIKVLTGNNESGFENGLKVEPEQDIALMGGDIQIETGKVIAPGGNIWLDSVSQPNFIQWQFEDKWSFPPQESSFSGTILIHETSRLFSSFKTQQGGINGQISLRGGQITIENSVLNAENRGRKTGSDIRIHASKTLDIRASGLSSPGVPSLTAQPRAKGTGGNIALIAQEINIISESKTGDLRRIVTDSARVPSKTDVEEAKQVGKSGNIDLIADQGITLKGGSAISAVSSASASDNSSGVITIRAQRLNILGGSQIRTSTRSPKPGGDLDIQVDERIILSGFLSLINKDKMRVFRPSGLVTDSNSNNVGGSVMISTPILQIKNGAAIERDSVLGEQEGEIRIKVEKLELIDGGQIGANVDSFNDNQEGTAGNINVDASKYILISGKILLPDGQHKISAIQADTTTQKTGTTDTVDITLETPLLLLNNAMISAGSDRSQGGKITLEVSDLLFLGNSSRILSNASSGAGGQINIKGSPWIISPPGSNSDITANSNSGPGGRIRINSRGIEGFRIIQSRLNQAQLEDLSENNINDIAASSGNPNLQGEVVISNPNSLLQEFAQLETPLDESSNIEHCQNSQSENSSQFRMVGQGGMVPSSLANIDLWDDTRTLTEGLFPSPSMTIDVQEDSMSQEPLVPIIQASGWIQDHNGQVTLTADIPNPHLEEQYQASKSCHSLG